jgi:MSHA biogenesis protein MshN
MSLINKMLQDLDARGGAGGAGVDPLLVKPVARPERRLAPRVVVAVGLVAITAVGGWFSWRTMSTLTVKAPAGLAAKATPAGPLPLAPVPPGMVRVTPPVSAPDEPPVAETPPVAESPPVAPSPVVDAPVKRPRRPAPAAVAVAAAEDTPLARAPSPVRGQSAEADYRRALADLADGRVTDAIGALERTLQVDPRHDSARQVLVGLLVEAHRNDDAMRQLQLGLGLDPRQPAMAMLLARLQLENGGAGAVETLQRSLPYARGNGDYQALFAGVLQRQGRNREAAEQYQAALAANPGNAVWLMGLGITLQADRRNPDALAAFQRAASSGTLPADLQAFVERKIQQLK